MVFDMFNLEFVNLLALALVIFVLILIAKGVCTVPQGQEWVVERFGRYLRTLTPGLSLVIPVFDEIAYRVVTKDLVLDIQRQEVITSDNAVISTTAVAFIKISDPVSCVYGVEDYSIAVSNLVQTALRSIIGSMTLDDALSSREQIKTRLSALVSDSMTSWGITLKTVEIQDIQPSDSMQQAMEQQAAAERDRKAMVTRSEGAKQSAILEAEGRLESAKRDANAEVTLAEASKKAIILVREGAQNDSTSIGFLLGQRYVEAMRSLGEQNNSKIVVLPADLQEAIKGILGSRKS